MHWAWRKLKIIIWVRGLWLYQNSLCISVVESNRDSHATTCDILAHVALCGRNKSCFCHVVGDKLSELHDQSIVIRGFDGRLGGCQLAGDFTRRRTSICEQGSNWFGDFIVVDGREESSVRPVRSSSERLALHVVASSVESTVEGVVADVRFAVGFVETRSACVGGVGADDLIEVDGLTTAVVWKKWFSKDSMNERNLQWRQLVSPSTYLRLQQSDRSRSLCTSSSEQCWWKILSLEVVWKGFRIWEMLVNREICWVDWWVSSDTIHRSKDFPHKRKLIKVKSYVNALVNWVVAGGWVVVVGGWVVAGVVGGGGGKVLLVVKKNGGNGLLVVVGLWTKNLVTGARSGTSEKVGIGVTMVKTRGVGRMVARKTFGRWRRGGGRRLTMGRRVTVWTGSLLELCWG